MIIFVNSRATRPKNRRFPLSIMAVGAALPDGTTWEKLAAMSPEDIRDKGLLTLRTQTRTGGMGRQSRQPTKPRLAVLARRATKSGAPGHPFPSGCCRKRVCVHSVNRP